MFGRARPATGFNTDIKALIDRMLADGIGVEPGVSRANAIAAPVSRDAGLWQAISRLRRDGECVVQVSEVEASAYSRQLVNSDGKWIVEPVS